MPPPMPRSPEAQRLQVAAESALNELRMAQMGWSMLGVSTLKTLASEVKALEKAHPEWAVRPPTVPLPLRAWRLQPSPSWR